MKTSASNAALADAFLNNVNKPSLVPEPASSDEPANQEGGPAANRRSTTNVGLRPLKLTALGGSSGNVGNANTSYNIKELAPDFQFLIMIELAETLAQDVLEQQKVSTVANSNNNGNKASHVAQKIDFLIGLCTSQIPASLLRGNAAAQQQSAADVASSSAAASKMTTAASAKKKKLPQQHNEDASELTENDLQEEDDDEMTDYTDQKESSSSNMVFLTEESQAAALALGHFLVVSRGAYSDKILPILTTLLSILASRCKWGSNSRLTPGTFKNKITCSHAHKFFALIKKNFKQKCKLRVLKPI